MKIRYLTLIVTSAVLSACAGKPSSQATPKVVHNARGVPSSYKVQSGDTVSKIASRYGLNWREISRINKLDADHTIYAGQWLTLWQPNKTVRTRTPTKTKTNATHTPTPTATRVTVQHPQHPNTTQTTMIPQPQAQSPTPPPRPVINETSATTNQLPISAAVAKFGYPVSKNNKVVRQYGTVSQVNGKETRSEGIWFNGQEGDNIVASQAGTVIFADDNSLMDATIAIRHANGFITEYRFIKDAKVKAGQTVSAGQPIASMKETSGVWLTEFRVAKNNVYIDPLTVLR